MEVMRKVLRMRLMKPKLHGKRKRSVKSGKNSAKKKIEAKAQKAREEEAAALEFEKWKGEFSIDAKGTTENEVQDGYQNLLSNFVEYIKGVRADENSELINESGKQLSVKSVAGLRFSSSLSNPHSFHTDSGLLDFVHFA